MGGHGRGLGVERENSKGQARFTMGECSRGGSSVWAGRHTKEKIVSEYSPKCEIKAWNLSCDGWRRKKREIHKPVPAN